MDCFEEPKTRLNYFRTDLTVNQLSILDFFVISQGHDVLVDSINCIIARSSVFRSSS